MHQSAAIREIVRRLREDIPQSSTLHTTHGAIVARLSQVAESVGHLERLAQFPDPTETPARHAVKVADAARRLEITLAGVMERVDNSVRGTTAELDQAADQRAGLREDQYATEIRSAARAMPPEQRMEALRDAVSRGDAGVVAALTSAPPIVAGFDPEFQSRMRDQFRQQHAPAETQAQAQLLDIWSSANAVAATARRVAQTAVDPTFLKQIQNAQKLAL